MKESYETNAIQYYSTNSFLYESCDVISLSTLCILLFREVLCRNKSSISVISLKTRLKLYAILNKNDFAYLCNCSLLLDKVDLIQAANDNRAIIYFMLNKSFSGKASHFLSNIEGRYPIEILLLISQSLIIYQISSLDTL